MWQIRLDQFEGPLDLLLSLVEREKLEITELSLARVCEQYRAYLQVLRDLDLDLESSYLVVLAQLVELKSNALLPDEPDAPIYDDVWMDEQPPDDPLVKKLREYKRIKEAAQLLGIKEREALSSFPRPSSVRPAEDAKDLSEVSLVDLLDALKKLLVHSEQQPAVLTMARVTLSVPQRMQQLWHRVLADSSRLAFSELLEGASSRPEIIVTFLALLELARMRRIRVVQERICGTIYLERHESAPMNPDLPIEAALEEPPGGVDDEVDLAS